ncbi:MAG: TonB-dependent receptor [Odoribacter sp.]
MKKNQTFLQRWGLKKVFFIMRLSFYLILVGFMNVSASINAQTTVDLKLKNVTLHDLIWELQKQTGFVFLYSTQDVESVKLSEVTANQKSVKEVLDGCLNHSGLTYDIHNDVIVIKKGTIARTDVPQSMETIKGKIVDNEGKPLPGVSIQIKGTTIGVASDMNGNFELKLPSKKGVVLVFSFVGMHSKEMNAPTSNAAMKVVLEPDTEQLEEVIVTGYGTFKKSAYAGSASTVKTSALKDIPAVSFAQVLQGAAPGIQISASSGQPGAATSIKIRGMGSFNASNSPLYVIDGVPMMSGDISATGSDSGLDIMSTLNTADIENVTVIKDAAAASLYGSRAANGVILITTKQGKTGKPVFSFKADWGFSDFAMEYRPTIGGEERRQMIYDALRDGDMIYGEETKEDAIKYADEEIDKYARVPWCGYQDWKDIMFKKGHQNSYEFSVSGGTDKMKYYSSLAYMKLDGITQQSGLERVSGRLNVDYQATKKLNLGVKMLFSTVNQDVYSEGTSYTAPFYASVNCVVPSDVVYNEDGTWNRDFIRNNDRNPVLSAAYNFNREYVTRTFNTMYASYELIKNLTFKSTLSYDYTITKGKDWADPRTSDGEDENGTLSKSMYERNKMIWSNIVSYQKTFADKHNLDVLVGYEIDDQNRDYVNAYVKGFARPDKPETSNGVKMDNASGSYNNSRLVSYISRVNYNYDNKYYFGASYRMDGSSRLQRDNRWGNFWSLSGAWKVNAEEFMKPTEAWLTDLRLRASYGVNGTLPSDYYGYMGLSSVDNKYNDQAGMAQSQLKNFDLSWETNYNFNVGLDMGFWNRLNVTLEYYTRTTKDLLMDRPISMTTGFDDYLMNIGEVKNQGVELEIRSTNFDREDFSWTTNFNLGHNKNEIIRLDGIQTEIPSGSQIRKVGMPYRTFYLMEFAGIDPDDGTVQFYTNTLGSDGKYVKDITKDPAKANYIPMKCADPKVSGGLGNTLRYKWLDLNFMFSYSFGGYSYDTWAQKTEHGGGDLKANIPTYYRNRWKQPGDIAEYERFIKGNDIDMRDYRTSRRLHSSDFIRLKNLTFGVSAPKEWIRKAGLEKVRLYASASNLWTWAKYDFYDPEAVDDGTAIWGTPPLRTVTFGLEVNF